MTGTNSRSIVCADAGNTDALNNLGVLLAEQERADEAEDHFRRAIDAGNTDALNNLGVLLAEQERADAAKQLYRD
ncbi:tetratricopeptide repeat protein [Saccharothrix texasensis]|uniref:tetratricopeptide repeat protein n=1 Tax=Saccharothrix texasensis TaxID=103734 RepID=UPI001B86301B|nr:tetratricopeptide repeat protein [Saccharothrix texasensis]